MIKGHLTVERYFKTSTWAAALVALAMAFVSDVFAAESKILLPVLIMANMVSVRRKGSRAWLPFLFLAGWFGIVWSLVQMILSRDVVLLGDALAFLMVLNLLHLDQRGRYAIVMGGGLLLCFSGLVLEPGVPGYLLFILYLLLSSISLNSANMFLNSQTFQDRKMRLKREYFIFLARSLPVGIIIAIGVFALFPRINSMAVDLPFSVKQRFKTGYNGEIDLGGQGEINQDDSVVLNVTSPRRQWLKDRAMDLYLRGSSLEVFDGVRWQKRASDLRPYNLFQPIFDNKADDRQTSIIMDVVTNPLQTNVIFLPDGRFSLRNISRSVGRLFFNSVDGGLYRESDTPLRYHYRVQIYPKKEPLDLSLSQVMQRVQNSKPSQKDKTYEVDLETLPSLLTVTPSLMGEEYFQRWLKRFSVDRGARLSDVFRSIRNHFRRNYRATLINQFSSKASFRSFIETDRFGHCEFFSTATVMLFRHLGIPSRIATGYRGGDYNEVAEAVMVRQLHAHAWVEYYIPGSGWYIFDPTPPISEHFNRSQLHFATRYVHAMNFWLSRYLVDYNLVTQRQILGKMRQALPGSFQTPGKKYRQLLYVLLLPAFVLALWYSRRLLKERKEARRYPPYLRIFQRYLKRKGSAIEKESYETYRNYCHRIIREGAVSKSMVLRLLDILEKDLYGPEHLKDSLGRQIEDFSKLLKSDQ